MHTAIKPTYINAKTWRALHYIVWAYGVRIVKFKMENGENILDERIYMC